MRAMVTRRFGGMDFFEERDVERPHPGAGEVLVRVVAAGTNPVDATFRASGDSAGLEAPIILGADISGVVEEAGPGVTDLARGDEVYSGAGRWFLELRRSEGNTPESRAG